MELGKVCLRRGREKAVRAGADWCYDNELDWADDTLSPGDVADVVDGKGRFAARGFFNPGSKIAVRVLTRDENETIDRDFFRRRLESAWAFRRSLGFENACRVVFGESDGLPGLTVDKFGDYLSFQTVSLGLERWKEALIGLLAGLLHPAGIYERNDVPVREKEGLAQMSGCVYGEVPPLVEIIEHEARMLVDIPRGQKTGHFLDQQENRGRIKPYCRGKTVLDLCCHTGGFSIHAALYGAARCEAVDVSEEALAMLRENAVRNGVAGRVETVCENVFDLARRYAGEKRRYGLVICDPPAFAKSRKALDGAWRGYKELNLRSMRLVEPGGYLLTCSCSQFMTPPLFRDMLREAAADSGRRVRHLETLTQSRDHPAMLSAEQSSYLKGEILQVL